MCIRDSSYWLKDSRGAAPITIQEVRTDLGVAYFLTVLFGMAIIIISAGVSPGEAEGYKLVIAIAEQLGTVLGNFGKWAFMIGFWGAIFSSMLGVWNGVPYLFTDFIQQFLGQQSANKEPAPVSIDSFYYRTFLAYMALPPLLLPLFGRPAWIGLAYSVAGAFFMPFLAALLLYMNNKSTWVGAFKNNWLSNLLLVLSLLLFLLLFLEKLK